MQFQANQIVVSRFSPIDTRMIVLAHLKSGVKVRKLDNKDRPYDRPIKVMPMTLALTDEPFYDLIRCEETLNDRGEVVGRSWEVVRTVAGLYSLKLVADLYVESSDRWNWYYQQVDAQGRPVGSQMELAALYEPEA